MPRYLFINPQTRQQGPLQIL